MRQDSSKLDLTGTGYCASFNFRRTARAVTQLYDAALQESGIRSTQFAILVGIAKNQPVSIGALAEVLIIDLGLPGKTGYEVAAMLRAHPDFATLPLIALSGYGQPANVEKSRTSGFNFHLLKPADPKLLLQLVETMIARRPGDPPPT